MHLNPLDLRFLAGFFLLLSFLREKRRGYFSEFLPYLKSSTFQPPLFFLAIGFLPAALIFFFDSFLLAWIQDRVGRHSILTHFGSDIGQNVNFWMTLTSLYLFFSIWRADYFSRLLFGAVFTSALTGLIIHILKFIFSRARPYADLGPYCFFNFGEYLHAHKFQSLPSGDVALVAGAASYLFFALKTPLRPLVFLFPLCTALARVSLNAHWPSDTVVSIVLSLAVAHWVWNYRKFA